MLAAAWHQRCLSAPTLFPMFDLRYHVASLTAVFVALVIGILVGIGLSGKGFVNDAERANLTGRSPICEHERDVARASLDAANRGAQALDDFADAAYPSVVPGRLEGKKVAVLFVGPVDQGVSFAVARACATRAAPSSARARSACRSTLQAVQDGLRRRSGLPPLPGARITSPISATPSRRSSPPAARHRSGTRSARSSSRNARARRRRLPMPSSSSGRPSRSGA